MSSDGEEWSEAHGSFLMLLKENEETLPDGVSAALQDATTTKSLTPTAVHAIGEAVLKLETIPPVSLLTSSPPEPSDYCRSLFL